MNGPIVLGDEIALGGGEVDDPVLELDLARVARSTASVMRAGPASRRRRPVGAASAIDAAVRERVLLERLERVDGALPALDLPRSGPRSRRAGAATTGGRRRA